MKYTNIAKGGGSNKRILRTLIEYIEEFGKPDFVLIGWTTHERFEFSFDGVLQDYTLFKQSDNDDLQKFYRYADLHLADWEIGKEETVLCPIFATVIFGEQLPNYLYCNMFNRTQRLPESFVE